MKISLNSIRNFNQFYKTSDDVTAIGLDKLVAKIGAQLGAVEEVIDIGSKYQGVVVAKVVSCKKHHNAHKLSVCMIDVGKGEPVQVVCGAPNVAEGQMVAWIPPGATVPDSVGDSDPFVLEAREIRGVVSNGMLASPKELALGEGHDGILVLDDWLKPGSDFAEAVGLNGDYVIDIENKMFTHRPDLFGYMGVARELAGIQGMEFKKPDWYVLKPSLPKVSGKPLKLVIKNEIPSLVPRFSATVLRDVEVGPSPLWLQIELAKVGQKSINNVVDLTNYFMQLTGQPLHAYDYDKVSELSGDQAQIVVRRAQKGDKLKLLNGKEIQPTEQAIIIATDKQPIGLGGIMGGSQTEVDLDTKNLIIEAANFDMYTTRRTSMAHGLFTDAVTRFSKGPSPLQTLPVLAKMTTACIDLTGAKYAGQLVDLSRKLDLLPPVKVDADFINARLGSQLSASDMKSMLENVEFAVKLSGQELLVHPPFWRTDIEIAEDIVEEIGRLHGYDHLPLELPRRDIKPAAKDMLLSAKAEIRQRLSRAGANEVLTYSFVPGDLLNNVGQDPKKAFKIANALSPDLQYYRLSLVPSLLEKVHPNIKAGYDQFALFEIGKTHGQENGDDKGLPREFEFTSLVVAANDKLKQPAAAYYQARRYLETLVPADKLEYKAVSPQAATQYQVVQPYEPARSAMVSIKGGNYLGIIGEFKPAVRRALKLPKYAAGFEVDTYSLQLALEAGSGYTPLSRFPSVKQDITLKVPADMAYAEVYDFMVQQLDRVLQSATRATLQPLSIYQPSGTAHKNLSWHIVFTNYERTLTDNEVNNVLDEVARAAKSKLSAQRV